MVLVNTTPGARSFAAGYETSYHEFVEAAEGIGLEVKKILADSGVPAAVRWRAKDPESLREKIRRKGYTNPSRQVLDLIGVRAIVYHKDDVDFAVDALSTDLDISQRFSIDKRRVLGVREFGYQAVHLVARLPHASLGRGRIQRPLRRQFEIQITTILGHAWAEIEHEVVYKSGIEYPNEVFRKFAAIAGTLELMEGAFMDLREARGPLIDGYRNRYAEGKDFRRRFDVARLVAFLEFRFPEGKGWRMAETERKPFAPFLDVSCLEALRAVHLDTGRALSNAAETRKFKSALRALSAMEGTSIERAGHPAVVALAVTLKNPRKADENLRMLAANPKLQAALKG